MTDADVIRLSLTDHAAFALLFDRHYARLHRFVRARIGAGEADDLCSDVFLVAFRKRAAYDVTRADSLPWLFGIAVNLLRDHRRSELRRIAAYGRAAPTSAPAAVRNELRLDSDLARALLELSEEDRHLLLLFAWAQLSYEQLAETLELPLGTVRSRLSRVRARVRAQLEPLAVTGESP
jgi:RNA polymerase sigma factor (sigma-70 family)